MQRIVGLWLSRYSLSFSDRILIKKQYQYYTRLYKPKKKSHDVHNSTTQHISSIYNFMHFQFSIKKFSLPRSNTDFDFVNYFR